MVTVASAGGSVTALPNPEPEVDPVAAGRHAAVVATGREAAEATRPHAE